MADLKVSFPEPCSEAWEDMASVGCNRHCASCDRIVHDLAELTVDEAEALLDRSDRVCVRAKIRRSGSIRTRRSTRAIVMSAGVMAVAACQTAPGGRLENGFTLSGQTFESYPGAQSRIRNAQGDSSALRIGEDGRFAVTGLRPGTYSLDIVDWCGAHHALPDIVVADVDVDLGQLDIEPTCIIVGRMVRDDEPERG